MTDTCLFCKIVSGEIKGTIVFNDDQATAFRDISPAAPTHILIVPNRHIESVSALESGDEQLMGHLFTVAGQLAKSEGIIVISRAAENVDVGASNFRWTTYRNPRLSPRRFRSGRGRVPA
jgi:hypothetical protein